MTATLSPAADLPQALARALRMDWTADALRRRARLSLASARRAQGEREGPAVLRLRMLELAHALKMGALDAEARADADAALAELRWAVLNRPSLSFADAEARMRTLERSLAAPCLAPCPGER